MYSFPSGHTSERNTHISQLKMIDEHNLIVTGTVCHRILMTWLSYLFEDSIMGKRFVAGINAIPMDLLNFNTTFFHTNIISNQ